MFKRSDWRPKPGAVYTIETCRLYPPFGLAVVVAASDTEAIVNPIYDTKYVGAPVRLFPSCAKDAISSFLEDREELNVSDAMLPGSGCVLSPVEMLVPVSDIGTECTFAPPAALPGAKPGCTVGSSMLVGVLAKECKLYPKDRVKVERGATIKGDQEAVSCHYLDLDIDKHPNLRRLLLTHDVPLCGRRRISMDPVCSPCPTGGNCRGHVFTRNRGKMIVMRVHMGSVTKTCTAIHGIQRAMEWLQPGPLKSYMKGAPRVTRASRRSCCKWCCTSKRHSRACNPDDCDCSTVARVPVICWNVSSVEQGDDDAVPHIPPTMLKSKNKCKDSRMVSSPDTGPEMMCLC